MLSGVTFTDRRGRADLVWAQWIERVMGRSRRNRRVLPRASGDQLDQVIHDTAVRLRFRQVRILRKTCEQRHTDASEAG